MALLDGGHVGKLRGKGWRINYGDGNFSSALHCLLNVPSSFIFPTVLEGRRIASGASRGRKVRTPQGAMPRNVVAAVYDRRQTTIHAGGKLKDFSTESATEN
jgi:hypothetical protein